MVHEILREAKIDPERLTVSGHADTRPRAMNNSNSNRAKNRRVDISIVRGNELDRMERISVEEEMPGAESTKE